MDSELKILLFLKNHISRTLTKIKLEKLGYDVEEALDEKALKEQLKLYFYDVVIADTSVRKENLTGTDHNQLGRPLLFLDSEGEVSVGIDSKVLLPPSFTEENFLQKFHYVQTLKMATSSEEDDIKEAILRHYEGDELLVKKICIAFLEGYEVHLDSIKDSFQKDDDVTLGQKLHAFKGALSALGESRAAKILRKIEILLKARQRQVAAELLDELLFCCETLVTEAEFLSR
jgi:HPt (histidine-containing phosphotransfer) domain-containing protein